MVAATSGSVAHFKDARHFASWFGLTPKEYSSGSTRYLGTSLNEVIVTFSVTNARRVLFYERLALVSVRVGT